MDTGISLFISIAVTMALSAFFSGMEIAFVSSNRMLAELEKNDNSLTNKMLSFFYRHPNGFVSTMLVGNNIVLVMYGILMSELFDNVFFRGMDASFTVPAVTILSTIVILFVGEFIPKTLFKNNSNRALHILATPTYIFYIVLWPVSRFATFLSKCLLRLVGVRVEKTNNDEGFSKIDLDYLVQSSIENAKNEDEIGDEVKIFQNALDFSDTKVRDCMIPRTEIVAVDVSDDRRSGLMPKFIESGHSKIVVCNGDIDHIVGYIHSLEMFRSPGRWQDCVNTMPFVPETMAAQRLMKIFLQQKKSLAVVVDEFGGTSGIVSLEDIVEEILGDIEDEHDNTSYVAKPVGDNEYILSARLEVGKVNEMFPLGLPESDEYMTVGGLILHEYKSFPKLNEPIKIGRFEFRVLKKTATKIEIVRLKAHE